MAPWYEAAEFYHIYPIGLCGAPARNEQEEVTHRPPMDMIPGITGRWTGGWETTKISGNSLPVPMNWV